MSAEIPEPSGELSYESVKQLLVDSDWPLGTTEVAEAFDISQQSAHYRLTQLHQMEEIERRKTGGSVYWRASS